LTHGSNEFEILSGSTPEGLIDKNRIKQIEAAMFELNPQDEPTKKCQVYLKQKIAQLRGLLEAIQDRSRMVHGYTIKSELKDQKLTKMSTAGVTELEKLQNDVDELTQ